MVWIGGIRDNSFQRILGIQIIADPNVLPVIFHDPFFFGLSRALVFSEPNFIRDWEKPQNWKWWATGNDGAFSPPKRKHARARLVQRHRRKDETCLLREIFPVGP